MPKGQSSSGTWNFHVKRRKCPCCNKKGLYVTGEKGWIACMYCKLLETDRYSDSYRKLKALFA